MKTIVYCAGFCAWIALAACASKPDHFYSLNTLPEGSRGALSTPVIHVLLTVNVPLMVDRSEMVLTAANNGVLILDHERWASPLTEQVSQTLARDIERRRSDVLIADRSFDQAASATVTMKVDIVRMSARRGGGVTIEAHWRIVDAGTGMDVVGGDVFESASLVHDYASVADGFSRTVAALADRLAASVRR